MMRTGIAMPATTAIIGRRAARLRVWLAGGACLVPWLAVGQPAEPDTRTTVGAQALRTLQARQQAASCAGCHGPDGRAPAGSPIPGLAGRPQAELTERMLAFKAGRRSGTVMPQLARGYSDTDIVAMAAWFAEQK